MLVRFFKSDWFLIGSSLLLVSISLAVLYSISSGRDGSNIFLRQLTFFIIGLVIMFFTMNIDYRYFRHYSTPLYFATLFLLLLVLIFGTTVRGTSGWIGFGSFNIQPVELSKLTLIIFLAGFISKKKTELGLVVRLIVSFLLVLLMIILVIKQPDFGSAMVLAGIWLGMTIFSGISWRYFIALLLIGIVLSFCSWFFLAEYQKHRIMNFLNPNIDPMGSGYNVVQSVVAVGSGGVVGKGLGHGSQSQLNFLPESHTDFIFAVVAEEGGFIGSFVVLLLYGFVFYRIKKIAMVSRDNFGYYLSLGIMVMLFTQLVVNVGMNIGLMPVTGIPLPLFSYGGSSLLVVMISLGILSNIYSHKDDTLEVESYYSY